MRGKWGCGWGFLWTGGVSGADLQGLPVAQQPASEANLQQGRRRWKELPDDVSRSVTFLRIPKPENFKNYKTETPA